MPEYLSHRTAELRMLQAEHKVARWELERIPEKRDFMDHVKRTIVERMLREIRGQLEQAITIEHGLDHVTDMEIWRGRVLVSVQSTQAPSRASVIHYLDEKGDPWLEGGGIRVPDTARIPRRAPDLVAAKKPEPKFDPKDLDAVLPNDAGTW